MRALLLALVIAVSACCTTGLPASSAVEATYPREMFRLCWNDGIGVVAHHCPDPKPVSWEQFPIRMYVAPADNPGVDRAMIWAADAALDKWNTWLDAEVFVRVDYPVLANLEVGYGGAHDAWLGVTYYKKSDSGAMGSRVFIFDGALWASDTMIHELGHVLGLDHDDWRESIMYPNSARVIPHLEPVDRYYLKKWHNL